MHAIRKVAKMIKKGFMAKMNKHIKYLILFLSLVGVNAFNNHVSAQVNTQVLEGAVSFKTGNNIYVKFASTSGIENGDTLFRRIDDILKPVLTVQHHSSISCLCSYIEEQKLEVGDKIYAKTPFHEKPRPDLDEPENNPEIDLHEQVLKSENSRPVNEQYKEDISGRLSIASYSNIYKTEDNSQRFRYTLSFKGNHISDSRFSLESYIAFTHKLNEWDEVKENLNNALKIYSLALNYSFNKNTDLWIGRKINPNLANIGAMDGLQVQHTLGNFYLGLAVGSRPDYSDYGLNLNLLELGAYFGHSLKSKTGQMKSSIAFFEQTNHSKTDRRFLYFQHNNSLIPKVNLFSSVEIDLFKIENEKAKSTFSLTGMYLSLNYRLSRKLSMSASYDARKNVIYYETYKDYANLTALEAARQGIRLRLNYRPFNYVSFGLNGGTRFMKNDARRTNTLRGNATFSKVPWLDASLTLSGNFMQTSYLDGEIYGARLTKNFLHGKLNTTGNYRFVNFRYLNTNSDLKQHIGEINLSWQQNKKLYLSVNFETTFQPSDSYTKVYLNVRKKF